VEEKAAALLYLIIKNHSFVDCDKRLAAACFLLFLERNNLLISDSGDPIISSEALASLTLFAAASKPEEKETVKISSSVYSTETNNFCILFGSCAC
jgi:prophage maintenance system killer protein